ncbi:hypothetical protein LCGC14_0611310 [marine sediment metagenome]|uniref:Uncharacterized protein n=1 Tax=marine sediment metagenome TaxID=412755 RepID=A0A0F9RCB2_9ZZZZ
MRKIVGIIRDGKYNPLEQPIDKPGVGMGLSESRPFKPTKFETLEGEPVITSKRQLKDICDKAGLRSGLIENSC